MKGCASKIAGAGCVVILLFIAVLVLAMLFTDETEESKEPVAQISAPALFAFYAKNEIEADDKYKDKYLEVGGYVDDIGKNLVGSPYITLLTNDFVGRVQCMIADQDVSKAAKIKKGQPISLVGKCNGKELINVVLYECTFKENNVKTTPPLESKDTQLTKTNSPKKEIQQSVEENKSSKTIDIPKKGMLTDGRDKKTYKYTTIGTQVWMAENLNFKTENSWCYEDKATNCKKYGRLYTYDAAMNACPSGWHLPSKNEWKNLFSAIEGNKIDDVDIIKSKVALKLKSKKGWGNDVDNNEENDYDSYEFAALPAGTRTIHDSFNAQGEYTFFWTSTEHHTAYDPKYTDLDNTEGISNHADHISFSYKSDWPNYFQYGEKSLGHSVRCIKN